MAPGHSGSTSNVAPATLLLDAHWAQAQARRRAPQVLLPPVDRQQVSPAQLLKALERPSAAQRERRAQAIREALTRGEDASGSGQHRATEFGVHVVGKWIGAGSSVGQIRDVRVGGKADRLSVQVCAACATAATRPSAPGTAGAATHAGIPTPAPLAVARRR